VVVEAGRATTGSCCMAAPMGHRPPRPALTRAAAWRARHNRSLAVMGLVRALIVYAHASAPAARWWAPWNAWMNRVDLDCELCCG
jgi:hypothetical protein